MSAGWAGDMTLRERIALALHDASNGSDGSDFGVRMMTVHGGPTDSSYIDAATMILATGHFDVHPDLLAIEKATPWCPSGCGCRLWTQDSDVADCACDGPCCWDTFDQFLADVLDHPGEYRASIARRAAP